MKSKTAVEKFIENLNGLPPRQKRIYELMFLDLAKAVQADIQELREEFENLRFGFINERVGPKEPQVVSK